MPTRRGKGPRRPETRTGSLAALPKLIAIYGPLGLEDVEDLLRGAHAIERAAGGVALRHAKAPRCGGRRRGWADGAHGRHAPTTTARKLQSRGRGCVLSSSPVPPARRFRPNATRRMSKKGQQQVRLASTVRGQFRASLAQSQPTRHAQRTFCACAWLHCSYCIVTEQHGRGAARSHPPVARRANLC